MQFLQNIWKNFIGKTKKEERIFILDACALKTKQAIKKIEEASKVILLTGTIRELDKNKKGKDQYGKNICIISKASREDVKSEKYVCVDNYNKYDYQDDNIIDYCRNHKGVIILTADNNLCNMAKAYRIPYVFLDDEEIKEEEKRKNSRQNIRGVTFQNGELYLSKKENNTTFVLRNQKILQEDSVCDVKLQLGDIIYLLKSKDEQIIIIKYEIEEIKNSNYAHLSSHIKMDFSELGKIEEKHLPKEVKNQIYLLFQQDTKQKEVIQNEKLERKEETISQEVCFYRNNIYVVRKENYYTCAKVEREGKLINIRDYKVGDLLYLLKYNKKKRYLKVEVYEIVKKNNKYTIEQKNKCIIWYINEIYQTHFSEELKEEIRKFYLRQLGY